MVIGPPTAWRAALAKIQAALVASLLHLSSKLIWKRSPSGAPYILLIGYQLGLGNCSRRQSQQQSTELSKKSIRGVPSGKPPTLKQIYKARNCESYLAQINEDGQRIDSKSLPLYTEEEWQQFRDLWREQGGHFPAYRKNDKRLSKAPPDFVPPFKAGQTTDGKGRGLFATRDIKKGEMTYGAWKNHVFFQSGNQFRRFLDALDDEKACDRFDEVYVATGGYW